MKFTLRIIILITSLSSVPMAELYARDHIKFDHAINIGSACTSAIIQDSDGLIWIGSLAGLIKYDGYELTYYKSADSTISGNYVTSIFESEDGLLWIATSGNGLNKYDKETNVFTNYRHDPHNPNSLSSDSFSHSPHTILEDESGILWIGTKNGLSKYDKENDMFTLYRHDPDNPNSLSNDEIWVITEDEEGLFWIGTRQGGLNKFDKKTGTFTHYKHDPDNSDSLSDNWVYSALEDKDGTLWVGTKNGLNKFDRKTGTFKHYKHDPNNPASLANNEIYSISEDKSGALWIHSYMDAGGLNKFDRESGTVTHYRHDPDNPDSLRSDTIFGVCQDRTGIFWILYNTEGLGKYDQETQKFNFYKHDPNNDKTVGAPCIVPIYEDSRGDIWLGTYGGGLSRYDRKNKTFKTYKHDPAVPDTIRHNYPTGILEDSQGALWISTWQNTLSIFDREKEICVRHYEFDNVKAAMEIVEDKKNPDVLWLGCQGFGLARFDKKTEILRQYKHDPDNPDSLSNDIVLALIGDKDDPNILWLALQGGGLDKFDKQTGIFTNYHYNPDDPESISDNMVWDVYEDTAGRFWVATGGGGLNEFDKNNGIFKHYTPDIGFPASNVFSMRGDNTAIWCSTEKGLIKFNPDNGVSKLYTKDDGICTFIFISRLKTRDNQLWFGGSDGVISFHPEEITDNPHIPPVVLTSFRQGGEESDFGMAIERVREMNLTWQKNFFEFEFASLNYTLPEKNRHAYMLEGFDTKWNHIGIRRYGKYTNVPGGTYTLRLRGSNNDGVWNEKGVAIRITVPSPPWKRWWAYSLYVIMLAGIVLGYIWHKTKAQAEELERQRKELDQERLAAERLRRIDKMKDEFLANTSHELRTPLNGIIGIAESLADGAVGLVTPEQSRNLAMISSSGRRLTNLVNDILDFSKLKTHDLDIRSRPVGIRSITEIVMALSRPLIGQKSVTLQNNIPDSLPLAHADEDRLQQILINLIGNAIKFTHEGQVTVSAVHKDLRGFENLGGLNEFIRISVSDTGIGIPEEEQERIFKSFEQADGSADREYGGTGLGLAVTKKLVELHGGAIEVESSPDRGAIFSFTLPVAQDQTVEDVPEIIEQRIASEAGVQDESFQNDEAKPETGDQQTVLVVDDEIVNIQVLKNHLSAQNYRVLTAQSGLQALEILQHEDPDIIILDLMMPRMSGYEVCRKIRETKDPGSMPIVMLTAKNRGSDLIQGFDCGANDYLVKPFNKGELLARAKAHLDLKVYHERLSASEKKYRSLHDRALEGIFQTAPDGRVISVNPALVRIMGYDSEEDLTSSVMNLGEEVYANRQDREEFIRLIRENGQVEGFETKFHRKDGTTIWVSLYSRSVHDADGNLLHFEGLLVDITERLEKEKAEREREVIRAVNEKIMDSINYAQRIQASVLPNMEEMRTYLPDSFFLWEPRDVVGGDIYFAERFEDGILIAVIDCTGHGVPGAFMSMIASSAMRRITINKGCHDPAEILKQMNIIVKTSLQQDKDYAVSDDGMDMAVCFIEARGETSEVSKTSEVSTLIFAGARLPLFHVSDGEVNMIKGDKQSIGYKRSDLTFDFTNHTIPAGKGVSFYMSTDGFWDQLGGEKGFSFGKRRFKDLLGQFEDSPFEKQQEMLVQAFKAYKGERGRQDDVAVVGFKV